jgi:hypothetical protein
LRQPTIQAGLRHGEIAQFELARARSPNVIADEELIQPQRHSVGEMVSKDRVSPHTGLVWHSQNSCHGLRNRQDNHPVRRLHAGARDSQHAVEDFALIVNPSTTLNGNLPSIRPVQRDGHGIILGPNDQPDARLRL